MIDFASDNNFLSDEQRMVRDSAATYFAQDAGFNRVRAQHNELDGYDVAVWRDMAELGWLGLRIPEDYDGIDASFSETTLLLEQAGRALAPEPLTACALLAAGVLANGENEALKTQFLPRFTAGEWVPALAWQETTGEQNAQAVKMVATRQGDDILLSGEKCLLDV